MNTTTQERPRVGRPRKIDARSSKLQLKYTAEEHEELRQIADARGLTMTECVLTAVRQFAANENIVRVADSLRIAAVRTMQRVAMGGVGVGNSNEEAYNIRLPDDTIAGRTYDVNDYESAIRAAAAGIVATGSHKDFAVPFVVAFVAKIAGSDQGEGGALYRQSYYGQRELRFDAQLVFDFTAMEHSE